ncbi:MAG: hypothetical protein GYA23_11230 [Methanomicrobiales archaeon]|nr:hypothetical protein [Methanomicrobiales archaeon]
MKNENQNSIEKFLAGSDFSGKITSRLRKVKLICNGLVRIITTGPTDNPRVYRHDPIFLNKSDPDFSGKFTTRLNFENRIVIDPDHNFNRDRSWAGKIKIRTRLENFWQDLIFPEKSQVGCEKLS